MTVIDRPDAILMLRLVVARQALALWERTDGQMELTRGGSVQAVKIVSEFTGKAYPRGRRGKIAALADATMILDAR